MTRSQQLRQMAWAALVAVLLATLLTVLKADDGGDLVMMDPMWTFCSSLEPYGYWFHWWDCHRILNGGR
jgi:hypothetical protein